MISVTNVVNERVLRIVPLRNRKEVSSLLWINVLTSQNTTLLPPKPKSFLEYLKQGIKEFHTNYVFVPADKAANNDVVVCRLHYVNTFKQVLDGTRPYQETSTDADYIIFFSVF